MWLEEAACSRTLMPPSSRASKSAPFSIRSRAASIAPSYAAAISKGVRPSLERASTLAPFDRSSRTLAASPAHHMSGVAAKSLAALGSAPASRRRRMLSRLPTAAEYMSGELPRPSRPLGPGLSINFLRIVRSLFRMGR